MLSQLLGTFVLFKMFFGGDGGGGGGAQPSVTPATPGSGPGPSVTPDLPLNVPRPANLPPAVQPSSFPVSPPALPPWPSGWEPDNPPPPEVVARAWSILPDLWTGGAGNHSAEMTGGRWITYLAEMMGTKKGVSAWRIKGSGVQPSVGPAPSPLPAPVPVTPVGPAPGPVVPPMPGPPIPPPPVPVTPVAYTSQQNAAVAMNSALAAHGYKKADMTLYRTFQQLSSLSSDGYPGTKTMSTLQSVLSAIGVQMAPVKVYKWSSTGGYDGVNAPTQAEWLGAAPAPAPAPAPVPGVTPVSYSGQQSAAVAMNSALAAHGYKKSDQTLYKTFQALSGMTADGYPGKGTMAALQGVLSAIGVQMAPVKVYTWSSRGGYDGVNAPTNAEWLGTAGGVPGTYAA